MVTLTITNENMNRESFSNWFNGPLLHTHLQIDGHIIDDKIENNQFTQESIVEYFSRFCNKDNVTVSDTNHAMIEIFYNRDNWKKCEDENQADWNQRRISFSSSEILLRKDKISHTKGILTGVETDIISENGQLTTTNDVLDKLDIVIASLHWRTWNGFQGAGDSPQESKNKILNAYSHIATNHSVDVLGHPTVFPSDIKNLFKNSDFIPILQLMKQNGTAMEINISTDLTQKEFVLERELIRLAGEIDIPLAIGSDIHNLNNFNFPGAYQEYITSDNWKEVFDYHKKSNWHLYLFRYLAKNITLLESLGITPKQIVNSSDENFNNWFKNR